MTGLEDNLKNENKTALRFEMDVESAPKLSEQINEAKAAEARGEEFLVPDTPELNEAFVSESYTPDPVRVRTTYVPRFTEVSEKFYTKHSNSPTRISVEKNASPTENVPATDPTKEEDENTANAVVIVSGSRKDEFSDESMKVYKFTAPVSEDNSANEDPAQAEPELDVYDEVISEVAPKKDEPSEEPVEEIAVPEEEQSAPQERKNNPIFNSSAFKTADTEQTPTAPTDKKGGRKGREYTSYAERDAFKDKFLDALTSLRIRLVAATLIALELLVFQCLDFFGVTIRQLGELNNAAALMDLIFASALLLLVLPELVRSFARLSKKIFAPELIIVVSYLLLFGYTLSLALSGVTVEHSAFGTLFSLQILAALFAAYFKLKADFTSFKLSSQNVIKSVIDERYTRTLPRENMALDGAVDEYDSKLARAYRTPFVDGFFSNSLKMRENSKNNVIILLMCLGVAAATATLRGLFTDSALPVSAAFETGCMVFLTSVPAFSILVHKLPFKYIVDEASLEAATFIGEESVVEAADIDVIAYEDTEVFSEEDVSVRKVHLYGKVYNTAKAMRQMYALFSAVGGPLAALFSASLDRKCSPAEDIVIEDDGLYGSFEGHTVLAGSEEFMLRHNVSIPEEDYKTKSATTDSTRVMYGAEDGEVYVKFFFRYSFSEEFTMLLPEFKEKKIVPLIYTRDPNITPELLRTLTLGEDMIRVMKLYTTFDEVKLHRRLESGIVSLDERPDTIGLALMAKKYTSLQTKLSIAELIAASVGAAASATVGAVLINGFSSVPGFAFAAWQLVLTGAFVLAARLRFKVKNKKGK